MQQLTLPRVLLLLLLLLLFVPACSLLIEKRLECGPEDAGCPLGSQCRDGLCVVLESPDGDGGPIAPGDWVLIDVSSTPFTMGSPNSEPDRDDDEVQHEVTLTRDYWIQTTEVTQDQYFAVMNERPSEISYCGGTCPVETVNWYMAAAYCNALSVAELLDECYECVGSGDTVVCTPSSTFATPYDCPGYRLPTESEWEYAARSGTTDVRYAGLDEVAWYLNNSDSITHPVGTKIPSAWGLYDMLGNVEEWCHDWFAEYPDGSATDPWGPRTGMLRVVRGGCFVSDTEYLRAASRFVGLPEYALFSNGFRPVRSQGR